MKRLVVLVVLVGLFFVVSSVRYVQTHAPVNPAPLEEQKHFSSDTPQSSAQMTAERVRVLATGLEVPWAIAFLPSGDMLVTERAGRVRWVSQTGAVREDPAATIPQVKQIGEGGLQGIALHPNFDANHFVYLYYTYGETGGNTLNRVSRYTFDGLHLNNEEIIVDNIPGSSNHDGGRIKFGPDEYLYITTGDAEQPSFAQNTNSLAGKILRVTDAGEPVSGNPFNTSLLLEADERPERLPGGDGRIYSYGHRNPQGITWDDRGQLWATEHGPSGLETGNDEFNKIGLGQNFGWPDIRGMQTKDGMVRPVLESGRGNTWAPAGIAFTRGSFYFGGLRGAALYQVTMQGDVARLQTFLKNEYGRLREVVVGPDNLLYVTTSNRDGRGSVKTDDDKILIINPEKL